MKKVCIITCYKDPDYVRAISLRAALGRLDGVEVIIVKNTHKGLARYLEVPLKTLGTRVKKRPDVYILTFRGYEILPITRILTIGRPLIFDEFINFIEWTVHEHHKVKKTGLLFKFLFTSYRVLLASTQIVLADTESHAAYSAKLMNLPSGKFKAIPVGTDEDLFAPTKRPDNRKEDRFAVFYYGNMLPLHGLGTVIEATKILKDHPAITFRIIGGDSKAERDVAKAAKNGAKIDYDKRVSIEQLAKEAGQASVCLGGPFGGTLQADMVITGKTYQFLSMGRPVVVGRNKESAIFSDRENAVIVEQADAVALAEALEWCYSHRQKLEKIGEQGRKLFEKKFSVDHIGNKLSAILEKVG